MPGSGNHPRSQLLLKRKLWQLVFFCSCRSCGIDQTRLAQNLGFWWFLWVFSVRPSELRWTGLSSKSQIRSDQIPSEVFFEEKKPKQWSDDPPTPIVTIYICWPIPHSFSRGKNCCCIFGVVVGSIFNIWSREPGCSSASCLKSLAVKKVITGADQILSPSTGLLSGKLLKYKPVNRKHTQKKLGWSWNAHVCLYNPIRFSNLLWGAEMTSFSLKITGFQRCPCGGFLRSGYPQITNVIFGFAMK